MLVRTIFFVSACLSCVAHGRRVQNPDAQLQSSPMDDSKAYPAEAKQAVKPSAAFIPSGLGVRPPGNPSIAGSHTEASTRQTRHGPLPSKTSSISIGTLGAEPAISNPGFANLHAVPVNRAADLDRHASPTHFVQSEPTKAVEAAAPQEPKYAKHESHQRGFGAFAWLASGVGVAVVFALIYRLISNFALQQNPLSRSSPAMNVGIRPAAAPRVTGVSMCAPVSTLEIRKPDTHRREYAYVELPNQLRAIVASDPGCDKAGAALCVNVGMCNERKDLPGLAHFLEHMLFTGSKKYPSESEYQEFVEQNGGTANAYTGCYQTTYMLDIKPDKLEEAVDRLSRFFYEPVLTRDCTEREINAVDSEFKMGLTSPWWRYTGIMNQSANPDHPWHVGCGNVDQLLEKPKERGIDLYEEMLSFYKDTHSANGMTLCVVGRESIEELRAMVSGAFSAVENKNLTMPRGAAVSSEPPFLREDWNRLLLQSPAQDVKSLEFSWVIPFQAELWRAKPSAYISHLLGHEGKGSITAILKERGLITACGVGGGAWLEGAFSLMNVDFELTDKGVDATEEIGTVLFTYLGMLQNVPVEKRIFDEIKNLAEASFKFRADQNPYSLCPSLAESLQFHPPQDVLAGQQLFYDYDPDGVKDLLKLLTLDSVRVTRVSKTLEDLCTDKDTTYESPMKFLPLEPSWLAAWGSAQQLDSGSTEKALAAAAAIGLALPETNPFIPEDLSLKDAPSNEQPLPARLSYDGPPVVYHRQDDVFLQPKADVQFLIHSPFIFSDIQSFVKSQLWCNCVEEALNEFSYEALVAGLSYSLSVSSGALSLRLAGFGDKLPELLRAVATNMRNMTSVPGNIYQIVADGYSDALQNEAYYSQPAQQCGQRYGELFSKGAGFPADERFTALQGLTRESLDGVANSILDSCHVETMAIGNMTSDDACNLAEELSKGLQLKSSLTSVPNRSDAALPPGSTVWRVDSTNDQDPNNAVLLLFQMRSSPELDANMSVMSKYLESKFFDVLRTQQQLGYIVGMGSSPGTHFSVITATVQTEFPPDYVRSRIDAFFEEQFKFVEESMPQEVVDICKAGVIAELQTKPKNLQEEMGRYMRPFSIRTFDFEKRQRLLEAVESVTMESIRQFLRDSVLQAPKLYIQVKKIMETPDKEIPEGVTVPTDPEDLRCWSGRQETRADFVASEWVSYPTEIK